MLTTKDFTVGQRLFFVESEFRRGRDPRAEWHIVTKVGRKFVTTNKDDAKMSTHLERRFEPPSMHAQGWPSGRFYFNEESYRMELAMQQEWSRLRAFTRDAYSIPAGLTLEDIKAINAKLGGGS